MSPSTLVRSPSSVSSIILDCSSLGIDDRSSARSVLNWDILSSASLVR